MDKNIVSLADHGKLDQLCEQLDSLQCKEVCEMRES